MRGILVAALMALSACEQSAEEETTPVQTAAPAAESTAWDRDLMALLPAIDRCIADAGGPRLVTFADSNDDVTLVRLQDAERRIDCRVSERDGVLVTDVRPRDESFTVQAEREAIFVRGPGENPGGECYEAPEVRDASGAVVGWMLDPEGC